MGAEDQADLLGFNLIGLLPVGDQLHDDEKILPVILDLGPLFRVEDVFQDQGMDYEAAPQLFQDLHLLDSHHIDPGNFGLLGEKVTGFKGLQLLFLKTLGIVFHQSDPRLVGQLLPDMDQRAGGKACLLGSLFDQFGHRKQVRGSRS